MLSAAFSVQMLCWHQDIALWNDLIFSHMLSGVPAIIEDLSLSRWLSLWLIWLICPIIGIHNFERLGILAISQKPHNKPKPKKWKSQPNPKWSSGSEFLFLNKAKEIKEMKIPPKPKLKSGSEFLFLDKAKDIKEIKVPPKPKIQSGSS